MSDILRANWLTGRFNDHKRFICEHGTRTVPERTASVDKNGVISLKVTGERDIYSEIQSHKDSCDLNIIVDRILHGDAYAAEKLRAREGIYGDFAMLPKSYMEFCNQLLAAEDYFSKLPIEEKEKYDNNVYQWIAQFDQNLAVTTEKVMSTDTSESATSGAFESPSPTE